MTTLITNKRFDEERALYAQSDIALINCDFDGPADGESAIKECRGVSAKDCRFNLRYPFWHVSGLEINSCELTPSCRAALWYCNNAKIENSRLYGIKAVRECDNFSIKGCDIDSSEFAWSVNKLSMEDSSVSGEYLFMRCSDISLDKVKLKGKYSFQYVKGGVIKNSELDTKDAFWHSENLTVENCVVKGEYLGWYSVNLKLVNCLITGTQPLCYCRGLELIDCKMENTDLCFEKSEVQARILSSIESVKNPLSGLITAPKIGQIIIDEEYAKGKVVIENQ